MINTGMSLKSELVLGLVMIAQKFDFAHVEKETRERVAYRQKLLKGKERSSEKRQWT